MTSRTHLALCLFAFLTLFGFRASQAADLDVPRVAAIVTAYYHNSHADVIVSRLLEGQTLEFKPPYPKLKLVSLFTDQVPNNDISRRQSRKHRVPIYDNIADALTLGTDKLAVDGVLLIAEHGIYPESKLGQIQYPKRRMFAEIVKVFERSGRVVPVFCDKHLADTWKDAQWIYDTAARMRIPMIAGSTLPLLWRYPPAVVRPEAKLKEVVALSYHRLDTYGLHALEMIQALIERRAGGESGVKAVQYFEGDQVWQAARRKQFDRELLNQAISRLREFPVRPGRPVENLSKNPTLCAIEYHDGLKVNLFTFPPTVNEWAAAWRYADTGKTESTVFWTQEARPFMHFGFLVNGIEELIGTGQPPWPLERTLMTSGVLDALHIARSRRGQRIATPHLKLSYRSNWTWKQPPPPPPGRPIQGQ